VALRGRRQQDGEIGEPGDDLVDPRDDHVNAREGCHHPAVPLVCHQDHRSGVRAQKVRPADPHLRGEELVPQPPAGDPGERGDLLGVRLPELLLEQAGHLLARLVDGGGDDVRGRLPRELDDVFPEVGLHHFDPVGLERAVQAHLLGDHRLRFDGEGNPFLPRDPGGDLPRLRTVPRRMDHRTAFSRLGDEPGEVGVEVVQRLLPDPRGTFPRTLEPGKLGHGCGPVLEEFSRGAGERDLELAVG